MLITYAAHVTEVTHTIFGIRIAPRPVAESGIPTIVTVQSGKAVAMEITYIH